MIAFVSGGARSGKSEVAEALAGRCHDARGGALVYLATATASDDEMAARIARHRNRRGAEWTTREAPLALGRALNGIEAGSVVLLDCLTIWTSRALYEARFDFASALAELQTLIGTAREREVDIVVVSNDLNEDVPPAHAETSRYVACLQLLHVELARAADRVVEVVAGQAIEWKKGGEMRC